MSETGTVGIILHDLATCSQLKVFSVGLNLYQSKSQTFKCYCQLMEQIYKGLTFLLFHCHIGNFGCSQVVLAGFNR